MVILAKSIYLVTFGLIDVVVLFYSGTHEEKTNEYVSPLQRGLFVLPPAPIYNEYYWPNLR
tara:strand:+ start:466 stop:648 length:183 start_codon:yes stop_codon:yes gene_type:complete